MLPAGAGSAPQQDGLEEEMKQRGQKVRGATIGETLDVGETELMVSGPHLLPFGFV